MNRPVMLALVSLLAAAPAGAQIQAPVANAGDDQTVKESMKDKSIEVKLDGSARTDPGGRVLTWQWRQTAGAPKVDLLDASTSTPSFKAPSKLDQEVVLTFTLTVTSAAGISATDNVKVTIQKHPPVADVVSNLIGPNKQNSTLILDASQSHDPYGNALTYRWEVTPLTPGISIKWEGTTKFEKIQSMKTIRGKILFHDLDTVLQVKIKVKLTVTNTFGETDSDEKILYLFWRIDLTFRGGSTHGARGAKVASVGDAGRGYLYGDQTHGGEPFVTLRAWPGRTAVFKLRLQTKITAKYGLEASYGKDRLRDSRDEGHAADNRKAFPSGITVTFKDMDGDDISNAITLAAGSDFHYEAHVTVGNRVEPADIDIRFRAYSQRFELDNDQLLGRLQVRQPKADVTLGPFRQEGSITPGKIEDYVDYVVTVRNRGDFAIKQGRFIFELPPDPPIEASLYHDADKDGILSNQEALKTIDNIDDIGGLELKARKQVIVRVRWTGAGHGKYPTTVFVDPALIDENGQKREDQEPKDNRSMMKTSILKSDVTVTLELAVDAGCDGVADTEFGKNGVDVRPGGCLVYRVTSHSSGNAPATDVRIGTRTPDRTTLEVCTGATSSCGPTLVDEKGNSVAQELVVKPPPGAAGNLVAKVEKLSLGEHRTLTFTVRVEQ